MAERAVFAVLIFCHKKQQFLIFPRLLGTDRDTVQTRDTFFLICHADFTCIGAIAAVAEHSILRQFGTGRPDIEDEKELRAFFVPPVGLKYIW